MLATKLNLTVKHQPTTRSHGPQSSVWTLARYLNCRSLSRSACSSSYWNVSRRHTRETTRLRYNRFCRLSLISTNTCSLIKNKTWKIKIWTTADWMLMIFENNCLVFMKAKWTKYIVYISIIVMPNSTRRYSPHRVQMGWDILSKISKQCKVKGLRWGSRTPYWRYDWDWQ